MNNFITQDQQHANYDIWICWFSIIIINLLVNSLPYRNIIFIKNSDLWSCDAALLLFYLDTSRLSYVDIICNMTEFS